MTGHSKNAANDDDSQFVIEKLVSAAKSLKDPEHKDVARVLVFMAREMERCEVKITIDNDEVRKTEDDLGFSYRTGGFSDVLLTPGLIEKTHNFILSKLKDKKLAKAFRMIAQHFRDHPYDGNFLPYDPKRQFEWEDERILSLTDRLRACRAHVLRELSASQPGKELCHLSILKDTRKKLELLGGVVQLSGGAETTPEGVESVPISKIPQMFSERLSQETVMDSDSDISGLQEWCRRRYGAIDPTLADDIGTLTDIIKFRPNDPGQWR